jgi:hypothetical protein
VAEGRSNQAIADRTFVTEDGRGHIASIFSVLDLLPTPDDHRRVLAVLATSGRDLGGSRAAGGVANRARTTGSVRSSFWTKPATPLSAIRSP